MFKLIKYKAKTINYELLILDQTKFYKGFRLVTFYVNCELEINSKNIMLEFKYATTVLKN